jgi:hypothetical protein
MHPIKHLSLLLLTLCLGLASCHNKPTPEPKPVLEGHWKGVEEQQEMFDENDQSQSLYTIPYPSGSYAIRIDEASHLFSIYRDGAVIARYDYWVTDNVLSLQGGVEFTIMEHTTDRLVLRHRQNINTTRYLLRSKVFSR